MALPNLPFPVAEFGWDKFDQVRKLPILTGMNASR